MTLLCSLSLQSGFEALKNKTRIVEKKVTNMNAIFSSMTQPASKKVAPSPFASRKAAKNTAKKNPLVESRPKNFGIGQGIQPKRNVSRYVKWPEYVRLQRQKKVLSLRLKVPPSIAQFSTVLDKNTAAETFKLLNKYRPETKAEKKERLTREAAAIAEGKKREDVSEKPFVVKYGLNHVVSLIENKKPKLVLIANDVDPIELVVYLPALCRKMGIPYAIVKGKARLGTLVHEKRSTVAALVDVKPEDEPTLAKLVSTINPQFIDVYDHNKRHWGGGVLGSKHNDEFAKRARAAAREAAANKE